MSEFSKTRSKAIIKKTPLVLTPIDDTKEKNIPKTEVFEKSQTTDDGNKRGKPCDETSESSSSGLKADISDESQTTGDKSSVEKTTSEDIIVESTSLSSESLSTGNGMESTSESEKVTKDSQTTDERKIEAGSHEDVPTATFEEKYIKIHEVLSKLVAHLNQNEAVQQWIKSADDADMPFDLKENARATRGATTWLNTIKSFGLLNVWKCFYEKTGISSDEEKNISKNSADDVLRRSPKVLKLLDTLLCLEETIPLFEAIGEEFQNKDSVDGNKSANFPLGEPKSGKCKESDSIKETKRVLPVPKWAKDAVVSTRGEYTSSTKQNVSRDPQAEFIKELDAQLGRIMKATKEDLKKLTK